MGAWTFRGYRGPEDAEKQYALWLKATEGLPYAWRSNLANVRAMMARADELGVDEVSTLLRHVDAVNTHRRDRMVSLVLDECDGDVSGHQVAVLGAAFKPGTDDVRDSPALDVAARLHALGGRVHVYDPRANRKAADTYPMLTYADSVPEAVAGADVVLHMTEWKLFSRIEPAALLPLVNRPRIIDGRNALDADRWRAAGWTYRGLGRPRLEADPPPDPGMAGGAAPA